MAWLETWSRIIGAELKQEVSILREECDATPDCLLSAGLLTHDDYLAKLHRRRFLGILSRHPCEMEHSLTDILQVHGVLSAMSTSLGFPDARELGITTPCVQQAVHGELGKPALQCNCLFLLGGDDGEQVLSSVERFDPMHAAWEALPPMTAQRHMHAAAFASGQIVVCGGIADMSHDFRRAMSSAESFDPTVNCWQPLPHMSVPRVSHKALGAGNSVFVLGGVDHEQRAALQCSAEYFDMTCCEWRAVPPIPGTVPESRPGAPLYNSIAAIIAGKLYLCCGSDSISCGANIEELDPDTKTWTTLHGLGSCKELAGAVVIKRRLYICGGRYREETLASAEVFDPALRQRVSLPNMESPRHSFTAVAISGSLYVFGGFAWGRSLNSAERFVPSAGVWESLPSMSQARCQFAAVVNAGRVYICGGANHSDDYSSSEASSDSDGPEEMDKSVLHTTECYDPTLNKWFDLPAMLGNRRRCVAVCVQHL